MSTPRMLSFLRSALICRTAAAPDFTRWRFAATKRTTGRPRRVSKTSSPASNVEAADGVAKRIHDAARSLIFQPLLGRKGQRPGTRELVVGNTPFTLIYRVHRTVIRIGRVLHQSRRYP